MTSIRLRFFFAFTVIGALACGLALYGFHGISASGDLVVKLYDGPLLAVNHARSANAKLIEARLLMQSGADDGYTATSIAKFENLLRDIEGDLNVVRERIQDESVKSALAFATWKVRDWATVQLQVYKPATGGLMMLPSAFVINQKSNDAVTAIDDLVETVAAYGFNYRTAAEQSIVTSRNTMMALSIGILLIGLTLATIFSLSMTRPIFAAMRVAERVAAGFLDVHISSRRRDEFGRLLQSLGIMQQNLRDRAIADQKMMAQIEYTANHDLLTGLCNRTLFTLHLDRAIEQLKADDERFSVLVLDLSKFKAVNDTLGHPAGDELLKQVAARLKTTLRDCDIVARLGGDEFAIIQTDVENQREAAIGLSVRIHSLLTEQFNLSGHTVNVGTSIGIAMAPEHGDVSVDLLRKADLALYRAKIKKGVGFAFYSPDMMKAADERRALEVELRNAIDRGEFELHYQPVISSATRDVTAVEALIRWRHPIKGLVPPDLFIPLAEESGMIVQIGEYVLQKACADAVTWPSNIGVAVNLSAVQFKRGNLFDIILCALVETGLTPSRLELEITETVLLENEQEFLTTIRQLKNLGITIALDDFGTGYSSLSYLTKFPFDKIKIDKSFTQGLGKRQDCTAIISSVLTLARDLGIKVTAEGVETPEQYGMLRDAGVDLIQGYLFGRPVIPANLDFTRRHLPGDAGECAAQLIA